MPVQFITNIDHIKNDFEMITKIHHCFILLIKRSYKTLATINIGEKKKEEKLGD